MRYLSMLVALVLATMVLWAQPDPNAAGAGAAGGAGAAQGGGRQGGGMMGGMGGMMGGMRGGMQNTQTLLVNTPKGIFMLRAGVLAKVTPDPLAAAKTLEVLGALPAQPKNADQQTMMQYMQEVMKRSAPALLVPKDNLLLIVIGDAFIRVDIDKMEQVGDITGLAPADAPAAAAQPGRMGMMQQSAPGYLLVDNTIYLARDTELLAINIPDGKIANRLTLPKELQITAPPMGGGPGGMGAGMGAGRAARGNRGNGGGGAAAGAGATAPAKGDGGGVFN